MTENVRRLIDSVVYNRRNDELFYAKLILSSDKTAKDERFCKNRLDEIEKISQKVEVPANCSAFVVAEKEPDIDLSRYHITESEHEAAEHIKRLHSVSKILTKQNIKHLNSMLLFGEPGTGKTTFGKYLAKSLGIPFVYLNISYLMDSLLGKTQQNLSRAFAFIKQLECVFMLDEIDAIAFKRGSGHDSNEMSRVTITLMQELDNINGDSIYIAATNRVDILDPAIMSRFGKQHEIKRLDMDGRKQMVAKYLDSIGFSYTEEEIKHLYQADVPQRTLEHKIVDFITDKYYNDLKI